MLSKAAKQWWEDLVESTTNKKKNTRLQKTLEVLEKNLKTQKTIVIPKENALPFKATSKRSKRRHYVGSHYPGLYVTPREKTALFHLASGMTFPEIAKAMKVCNRAIEYFMTEMRRRTGSESAKALLKHPGIQEFLNNHSFANEEYETI